MGVGKSVDGLVMVLLGGIQTLAGPIVGATVFTWLQDSVARSTDYWRALLGATILLLVLAFPQGIAGFVRNLMTRREPEDLPPGDPAATPPVRSVAQEL
jgi:branched-chain amino acid transport system permease protein